MQLNRFEEFISESIIYNLLTESQLSASGEFMDRLGLIKKDSDLAKRLLKGFKKLVFINSELPQNFIDVTPVEDMVSFISDKKADDVEDPYNTKGRGTIKIGRLISALLSNDDVKYTLFGDYTPTAKDIEQFVNLYKASKVDKINEFRLVDGEEIAYWYDEKRYYSNQGQLGNSCMKDVDKDYFDIYVKNPRVCKLLIYVNGDNELLGRALVWKLEKSPVKEAKWFMDRVYVNRDSDINRFKEHARKEGWLYKYKNNYDHNEGVLFYLGSTPILGKVVIKLRNYDFKEYPFIDTVSFFDKKEGTLSNVGSKKSILLTDTRGGDAGYCDYCDGKGKQEMYDYEKEKDKKVTCDECVGLIDTMKRYIEEGSYPEFKTSL